MPQDLSKNPRSLLFSPATCIRTFVVLCVLRYHSRLVDCRYQHWTRTSIFVRNCHLSWSKVQPLRALWPKTYSSTHGLVTFYWILLWVASFLENLNHFGSTSHLRVTYVSYGNPES